MSKNRCKIVLFIPGTSFHSLATIMFRIVKSVHHFVFIQEGKIIGSSIQRGGHNNIVKLPRIMKRHIWNPTPSRNTFLFGVNMDVIQINSTIIGIKIGMKHHFGSCFNEIKWNMFPIPEKNIKISIISVKKFRPPITSSILLFLPFCDIHKGAIIM